MDDAARLATLARAAADEVRPGMILGLGTGSTADAVLHELGRRVAAGLRISGVPTSARTARLASDLGILVVSLDEVDRLSLGIDGADEIDPALDAVKGRGGALLHEKLVALACDDYLLVAAAEKLVPRLGSKLPVPVEVVPFGWRQTAARLAALACRPTLRPAALGNPSDAPFVTDGGHHVLDCAIDPVADPAPLAAAIKATPGVVDHGFFLGLVRRALIAQPDGSVLRLSRDTPR